VITLPRSVRVWAYGAPADLRKGYNGLGGLVKEKLGQDVMGGDLFLFVNVRRTSCKVMLWDGTGLCIFMKRLLCASPHKSRYAKRSVMRPWHGRSAAGPLTSARPARHGGANHSA